MANPIVIVNVSQQVAPLPETLQKTGAIISVGATILSPSTSSYLTQLSDLTPLLKAPAAITSGTWSGGTVTITTTAPHGLTNTDTYNVTIAGFTTAGYNGTFIATITGTSTFTYAVAATLTTPAVGSGNWVNGNQNELVAMATTFFAQGNVVGIYVLELGTYGTSITDTSSAITYLSSYITANPNSAYV